MEPRDGYFRSQGLLLHYLEWGERRDPTLVLVHGFLDHAWTWEWFVAELGAGVHVIALDCRGHGDSGWLRQGYYHFPDYVYDLYVLIKHLGKSPVTLVGHSMGGSICFLYAGAFPESVTKLILLEGTGPAGYSFDDAPNRLAKWIQDMEVRQLKPTADLSSMDEAVQRLIQRNPRISGAMAATLAEKATRQGAKGKRVWKFDPMHRTTSPQPFYAGQAMAFFHRISCPTLLVRGKESSFAVPDESKRHAAFRLATEAEVAGAGHMIHVENPKELSRVVRCFLEGNRDTRDGPTQ